MYGGSVRISKPRALSALYLTAEAGQVDREGARSCRAHVWRIEKRARPHVHTMPLPPSLPAARTQVVLSSDEPGLRSAHVHTSTLCHPSPSRRPPADRAEQRRARVWRLEQRIEGRRRRVPGAPGQPRQPTVPHA
eukprot:359808-Chlamydomonas_euryale.AAC.5